MIKMFKNIMLFKKSGFIAHVIRYNTNKSTNILRKNKRVMFSVCVEIQNEIMDVLCEEKCY